MSDPLRAAVCADEDFLYLLGYGDTTSFYRAFRAWTGLTSETARRSTSSEKDLMTALQSEAQ